MFIFSIYRLPKLELRWKVVQKYEKYVYVTFPLNPLSRKGDLPSLRSKSLCLFSLSIVFQNLNFGGRSGFVHENGDLVDKSLFFHGFVHEIGVLVDKSWGSKKNNYSAGSSTG